MTSNYNLPSLRNFDQLHEAVCKDRVKATEMVELISSYEAKIETQRQERIKRLMHIDEQVMKLQEELL